MKYLIPLFLALVAAGTMSYILFSFLKRLRKIEDDFWGTYEQRVQPTEPPPSDEELPA
jgi:hypothetical protein